MDSEASNLVKTIESQLQKNPVVNYLQGEKICYNGDKFKFENNIFRALKKSKKEI